MDFITFANSDFPRLRENYICVDTYIRMIPAYVSLYMGEQIFAELFDDGLILSTNATKVGIPRIQMHS